MVVPRIAVLVPLLAAGMYLPALGHDPARPPAGTLGMTHEGFSSKSVTLNCGQTLRMQNDSRWVHIIGPGRDGVLNTDAAVPIRRRQLTQTNNVYTTGAWTVPGVHYVTCAVHPEMNVKVIVRGCCCDAAPA